MNRILRLILAFTIIALFASGILAQTVTTGSISGVVTDQTGAAVPEITVTATSPNLIQPQSATTGPDGRYTILNLPPGKYTLIAEAQKGFARLQQSNIDVNLGKTSPGDVQLQLAGLEAEVSVTAGSPLGIAQATTGNNVSTDQFSNFPPGGQCKNCTLSPRRSRVPAYLMQLDAIVILRSPALPERRIATFWMGSAFRMQLLEAEVQTFPLNLSKK